MRSPVQRHPRRRRRRAFPHPQSIVAAPCASRAPRAYSERAPRGTAVRADGSFRWRTDFQVVEGRFSADGRTVERHEPLPRPGAHDCGSETTAFSGRLVRRVAPDGTCEPLLKGRTVGVGLRPAHGLHPRDPRGGLLAVGSRLRDHPARAAALPHGRAALHAGVGRGPGSSRRRRVLRRGGHGSSS